MSDRRAPVSVDGSDLLDRAASSGRGAGIVHLVGAGLGGRGSLTRRAARLLAGAEVVVLDRRSLDDVAMLAPADAERVHVGRRPGGRAWSTDEVVALLADRAGAGRRVVRLKGGDPFVCSRGAEEALALAALGIEVRVTPGITAATAAGAVSGLDRGPSLTIASGNHDPAGPVVDWPSLAGRVAVVDDAPDAAPARGAVVVLTGRSHQSSVAAGLLAGGRPATTGTAVVHGVGRPDASLVATTLGEVATVRLPPPAALVVGWSRGTGGPLDGSVDGSAGGDRAHP